MFCLPKKVLDCHCSLLLPVMLSHAMLLPLGLSLSLISPCSSRTWGSILSLAWFAHLLPWLWDLQEPSPCSPAVSQGPHPKPTIHHHPVKKWWEEYILNKKHFSSKHSNVSEWELCMLTDGAATLPQPQAALMHTWINTVITLSQKCLQINWQGNFYFLNMQSNCCILSLMDISGGCKMQLINPFSSSPLYSLLSYSSSHCVCSSATSKLGCLHAAFSRCAKQII